MLFFIHAAEDDLIDIKEEILVIKADYYALGQALRLSVGDLRAVQHDNPRNADQALTNVLYLWLCQKYRVEKFGEPTWKMLVEAVDHPAGGNNHALAKKIAKNHPVGKWVTVY